MDDKTKPIPIASTRVGDEATVLVLGIHYDGTLICDRNCHMLESDEEGIIVCGLNRVKNIVNFRTNALVIEYQCILDKDADDEWRLYTSDFKVIDNEGFIHEGSVLCDSMKYPVKTVESGHTLYKGTRAHIVIYYPDFPKDRRISSIVIDKSSAEISRIELDTASSDEPGKTVIAGEREVVKDEHFVFNPRNPGDLFDRIDRLEDAVRELQEQITRLSQSRGESIDISTEIPVSNEQKPENQIEVKTVSELLQLTPEEFRTLAIQMLHGQGFKNIVTNSGPDVGYASMSGSRFGTTYAIFAVQENQSNYSSDLRKVKWLISFQKTYHLEKAIYITSAKLSPEAESEALSNHVEVLDIDRIASMLSLRNDSFGYSPLQH